ncbi:hypothetical protein F4604DRAFT_1924235 [Suillus subluteus]|nr:hypothetical protein F4604DRAFT_1924235 [Suillus subluteus]
MQSLSKPLFFTDPGLSQSFTQPPSLLLQPSPLPTHEPGTCPHLVKCHETKFIPYSHLSQSKLKGRAIAEGFTHTAPSMAPSQHPVANPTQSTSGTSQASLGPWSSTLNKCSLLEEPERKQQLQNALSEAASRYTDKVSATTWAILNQGTLYKQLPPLSERITATCKRIAHTKV